jgi:hypothetical protein
MMQRRVILKSQILPEPDDGGRFGHENKYPLNDNMPAVGRARS